MADDPGGGSMSGRTQFIETDTLRAFMLGDDDGAQRLIEALLPSERTALHEAACKLSQHTHPARYCGGCRQYIADLRGLVSLGLLGGPRTSYHRGCVPAKAGAR